jgi:carbon storage regulator CsrA
MLVLTRRVEEGIVIADQIRITIVSIRKGKVRLGIDAPRSTRVERPEVQARRASSTDRPEYSEVAGPSELGTACQPGPILLDGSPTPMPRPEEGDNRVIERLGRAELIGLLLTFPKDAKGPFTRAALTKQATTRLRKLLRTARQQYQATCS